jgi:hypothetical protein
VQHLPLLTGAAVLPPTRFEGLARLAQMRGLKKVTERDVLGVDYVLQNFDELLRSMLKASYKLLEFSALDFREKVSKVFQATKNLEEVKGNQPELPYRSLPARWSASRTSTPASLGTKVFALLNLSKGSNIFKDVAFSITEVRRLDTLTLCNCARETPSQLPSWAPD